MKSLLLATALVAVAFGVVGFLPPSPQPKPVEPGRIQWMSITDAYAKNQKQPRKLLIDVYTDWCGWCKVMDKNTFRDPKVAAYINQKFYAVKLDAEQREPITLGPQKFEFVPQGQKGYHQLAAALLNGQMSYPSVVFLDEKLGMIQPLPGYRDAKEFHLIATYFGDDHYKSQKFDTYQAEIYPKLFAKK